MSGKLCNDAPCAQDTCGLWHDHYSSLLNSSRDISKKESVKAHVAVVDYVDRYKVSDISSAISKLKRNTSPGADMLCSENFRHASDKLHVMLNYVV